jgi:hypothetical protein
MCRTLVRGGFVASAMLLIAGAARVGGPLVVTTSGQPVGWSTLLPVPHHTVLFLFPESSAGLTSPAGAGDGAFLPRDERVVPLSGAMRLDGLAPAGGRAPAGAADVRLDQSMDYGTFRQLVRDLVVP